MRLLIDACITFYGIMYSTSRLIYRWRRTPHEAAELKQWSHWHMAVLIGVAGIWLIASGVLALKHAMIRPSMAVGLVFVLFTIFEC